MSNSSHRAIALALLAAAATSACDQIGRPCAPSTPAQEAVIKAGNPFGIEAPQIVDQTNPYDSRFGITTGDNTVTVFTSQIRPGETYRDARDRAFNETNNEPGTYISPRTMPPEFSTIAHQEYRHTGGNAVAQGLVIDGQKISFADLGGLIAAGVSAEQIEFYETVAATHVDLLNNGGGALAQFFQQYPNQAAFDQDAEAATALFGQATRETNQRLTARFGGTAAQPAGPLVCDADSDIPARTVAPQGIADTASAGGNSNSGSNNWWQPLAVIGGMAAALWALSKLGGESRAGGAPVAAVAPVPNHKFEILGSINEDGKEVLVCRNTGKFKASKDADAIWVFERLTTEAPEDTVKHVRTRTSGAFEVTTMQSTTSKRLREDEWRVTTGPERLASDVMGVLRIDNVDNDQKRDLIRAITTNQRAEPALPTRKNGKLLSAVVLRKDVGSALTATQNAVAGNIGNTLQNGRPLPVATPA